MQNKSNTKMISLGDLDSGVVAVCGSFRFQAEMNALRDDLKQRGIECLMPIPNGDVAQGIQGCFGRIDKAEAVIIVNPGGYIGGSVLVDMGYACAKQKPIYATAEHDDPAIMCLITAILRNREN